MGRQQTKGDHAERVGGSAEFELQGVEIVEGVGGGATYWVSRRRFLSVVPRAAVVGHPPQKASERQSHLNG